MRLNKPAKTSTVTAEQKRLEKERQALERQRMTLEKQCEQISKAQPRKSRKTTLNVDTIINSPAHVAYGTRPSRAKRKMLPARELNSARIKFLVLALILATLVVMLWNAMPS